MSNKIQSPNFSDEVVQNILADMVEHARLKTLSNEELVMECLKEAETAIPVVEEMMDRLFPGWADEGH